MSGTSARATAAELLACRVEVPDPLAVARHGANCTRAGSEEWVPSNEPLASPSPCWLPPRPSSGCSVRRTTDASDDAVPESAVAPVREISRTEPTCAATPDAVAGGAGTGTSLLAWAAGVAATQITATHAGIAERNACRRRIKETLSTQVHD